MILEAESPSCFSDHYILRLNDKPLGEFQGRWFSECADIRLSNRRRFHFEKSSWVGSNFTLVDASDDTILASASRVGVFTSAWDLTLSIGRANLVSAGVFNTGFQLLQGEKQLAEVNRTGVCGRGWMVQDHGLLGETDLLFVGLIYHTVLKRRASAAAASAS